MKVKFLIYLLFQCIYGQKLLCSDNIWKIKEEPSKYSWWFTWYIYSRDSSAVHLKIASLLFGKETMKLKIGNTTLKIYSSYQWFLLDCDFWEILWEFPKNKYRERDKAFELQCAPGCKERKFCRFRDSVAKMVAKKLQLQKIPSCNPIQVTAMDVSQLILFSLPVRYCLNGQEGTALSNFLRFSVFFVVS